MKDSKRNYSTEAYFSGIKTGDEQVLKSIFSEYMPGIRGLVLAGGGTAQEAEDVLISALESMFRKLQNNELQPDCTFYTYLYEICKYIWLKKMKDKNAGAVEGPAAQYILDLKDAITQTQQNQDFLAKFDMLGTDCQRILTYTLVEDKDMDEIAQVMGFASADYVKKKKFICKEQLFELIQKNQLFPESKA